jgi:hypothetical protein
MCDIEFIETPTFTRLLTSLLTDDEYVGVQNILVEPPQIEVMSSRGAVEFASYAMPFLDAVKVVVFG